MSKYKAIQLKGGRMAIEHKGRFAYFGRSSSTAKERMSRVIDRIEEFVFEERSHSESDLA